MNEIITLVFYYNVSLQFYYNLSLCKFYIDTRKPPIVGPVSFSCISDSKYWARVARLGSWGKGRASFKGYRLCTRASPLERKDSSPLHWWGHGVPPEPPDCSRTWNGLIQICDVSFLLHLPPCLCCPCSQGRREEWALPGWLGFDWLSSCCWELKKIPLFHQTSRYFTRHIGKELGQGKVLLFPFALPWVERDNCMHLLYKSVVKIFSCMPIVRSIGLKQCLYINL